MRFLPAMLVGALSMGTIGLVDAGPAARNGGVERGKAMYRQYCAVCHGNNGKGHGTGAVASKIHPTDLAALRRINKNVFPAELIDSALQGADPVVAHGTPGMMVWGSIFLAEANGNEAAAAAARRDLIAYIESIQEK